MTTLASSILDLARLITDVRSGIATGGSSTTLIDSARTEPLGWFDAGTIWFLSGNNAGKSAIITTWTLTTTTFAFLNPGAACAANDLYAAIDKLYPRDKLREFVNRAIMNIGGLQSYNTSLTTVANQAQYNLPAGVYKVSEIAIAQSLSAPYKYKNQYNWWEDSTSIQFMEGFIPDASGYTIKLTYTPRPSEVTTDTGAIDDLYHPDRIAAEAAVHALRWRKSQDTTDRNINELLNEAISNMTRMIVKHQLPAEPPPIKLSRW